MSGGNETSMWVVYDHPADHPKTYVARRFVGGKVVNTMFQSRLSVIRYSVAYKRKRRPIPPGSDPSILEIWI